MPLKKSGSDKARSENIAKLIREGYSRKQAAAIGYSVQRKAKHLPKYKKSKVHSNPGVMAPYPHTPKWI